VAEALFHGGNRLWLGGRGADGGELNRFFWNVAMGATVKPFPWSVIQLVKLWEIVGGGCTVRGGERFQRESEGLAQQGGRNWG